jgi:hypothetical protein
MKLVVCSVAAAAIESGGRPLGPPTAFLIMAGLRRLGAKRIEARLRVKYGDFADFPISDLTGCHQRIYLGPAHGERALGVMDAHPWPRQSLLNFIGGKGRLDIFGSIC